MVCLVTPMDTSKTHFSRSCKSCTVASTGFAFEQVPSPSSETKPPGQDCGSSPSQLKPGSRVTDQFLTS